MVDTCTSCNKLDCNLRDNLINLSENLNCLSDELKNNINNLYTFANYCKNFESDRDMIRRF